MEKCWIGVGCWMGVGEEWRGVGLEWRKNGEVLYGSGVEMERCWMGVGEMGYILSIYLYMFQLLSIVISAQMYLDFSVCKKKI